MIYMYINIYNVFQFLQTKIHEDCKLFSSIGTRIVLRTQWYILFQTALFICGLFPIFNLTHPENDVVRQRKYFEFVYVRN